MTDPSIVIRKLAALRESVDLIRAWRPADAATMLDDRKLRDAIALNVLVAVQESVDIAFHVCTDEGWGTPASYRQAFELLADHQAIDRPLAEALVSAAGLRNRIAHGYATLDAERLWQEIPFGIAAFDAFAFGIKRFLGE